MGILYYFEKCKATFMEPFQWLLRRSPRQLLLVNNVILTICSISMTAFALYLMALFYKSVAETSPDGGASSNSSGWMQWLALAIIGISLTCVCIIGIRGAKIVSLELLMIYFWGIAFFLAPLLYTTVLCFEFYTYIDVYFRHHWEEDNFLEIRKLFCEADTADNKCVCPILGGSNYDTELAWCQGEYGGATDCESIRETAVNEGLMWGTRFTLIEASIGVLNVSEIAFSLYLCFKILTLPVIYESMNDYVNLFLAIPVAACSVLAYYLWWMRDVKEMSYSWLTDFFIAVAVGLFVLVPFGLVAGRLKRMDMMTAYMITLFLLMCGLASVGIACMLFSVVLKEEFSPTEGQAADIACSRDLPGCCCCGNTDGESQCPEWTQEEIIHLSVLDLKMSGLVAFICLTYLVGALVVAGVVREKLKNYKVEYI